MFIENEAEIAIRVGNVRRGIAYLGKLVLSQINSNSVLQELRSSYGFAVIQEEIC